MGGRSPRLQRRVGSLTSDEVISSFNYTVSNFDNEDSGAAWVRRSDEHDIKIGRHGESTLENSNLENKLQRLLRFQKPRRI